MTVRRVRALASPGSRGAARDALLRGLTRAAPPLRAHLLARTGARSPAPRHLTAVVPTGSDARALERFLESLAANTTGAASLMLVEDGADAHVRRVLEAYRGLSEITVAASDHGSGPAASDVVRRARDDVVTLDPQDPVPRRWKQRVSGAEGWGGRCRLALARSVRNRRAAGGGAKLPRVAELARLARTTRPRPRVLFVAPGGSARLAVTAAGQELAGRYEPLLMTSSERELELRRLTAASDADPLLRRRLRRPFRRTDLRRPDLERLVRQVLADWQIELVHLHGLAYGLLDLPLVAGDLEIPVVISLEDGDLPEARPGSLGARPAAGETGAAPLPPSAPEAGAGPGDRFSYRRGARSAVALGVASAVIVPSSRVAERVRSGYTAGGAHVEVVPPEGPNAAFLEGVYDRVLDSARTFVPPSSRPRSAQARVGSLKVAAFLPGTAGRYHGHLRLLRRLEHPAVRRRISARLGTPDEPPALWPEADVALVQRTGVAPAHVERFLDELDRAGIPLVFELDDDLFEGRDGDAAGDAELASMRRLLEAASLVTVSTERLRERFEPHARRVVVVPNMLDDQLWLTDVEARTRTEGAAVQILYMGTETHAGDLALLAPALDRLRGEAGLEVELSVVGGEPPGPAQEWYRRVAVPPGCGPYPRFVRWLRGERARWDIAVAPLADTPFNASKSDLKFLEYAGLGLPGVFSDVPAYETCRDGATALVTANGVDGWAGALERLCRDQALRRRIAHEAEDYALSERCIAHDAADYVELMCSTVA